MDAWGSGHGGRPPPGPADLASFPYVKACFLESLRLYPPAPRVSRVVQAPAELGGLAVPAGTMEQARLGV